MKSEFYNIKEGQWCAVKERTFSELSYLAFKVVSIKKVGRQTRLKVHSHVESDIYEDDIMEVALYSPERIGCESVRFFKSDGKEIRSLDGYHRLLEIFDSPEEVQEYISNKEAKEKSINEIGNILCLILLFALISTLTFCIITGK